MENKLELQNQPELYTAIHDPHWLAWRIRTELLFRPQEDVIKALCHLTGTDYNSVTSLSQFIDKMKPDWGKWYSWCFFDIRGYKKGTMHFKFQDIKLWERFNRRVAEIKGWQLPQKTDSKTTGRERSKSMQVEVFEF